MTKGSSLFYLVELIYVSAGRFPRAWPQTPLQASSPVGSSAHAIPAGVAVFHSNQP